MISIGDFNPVFWWFRFRFTFWFKSCLQNDLIWFDFDFSKNVEIIWFWFKSFFKKILTKLFFFFNLNFLIYRKTRPEWMTANFIQKMATLPPEAEVGTVSCGCRKWSASLAFRAISPTSATCRDPTVRNCWDTPGRCRSSSPFSRIWIATSCGIIRNRQNLPLPPPQHLFFEPQKKTDYWFVGINPVNLNVLNFSRSPDRVRQPEHFRYLMVAEPDYLTNREKGWLKYNLSFSVVNFLIFIQIKFWLVE